MVILIRSNEANPDPRLQKYINYLESINKRYLVIAWDRSSTDLTKKNYIYFKKEAKYGLGIKNLPKKLMWFIFILKQLLKYRNDYDSIHACDLDTAIPAYIIKKVLKKKVIFDVFDWMSVEEEKRALNQIIKKVENNIFKGTDYVILCEKQRINQVSKNARRQYSTLPNIPDIDFLNDYNVEEKYDKQRLKYKTIISYVGVFDANRGLEDLLNFFSKNKNFCLNIAGFGYLEPKVIEYARENENIIYWGKVDYNQGLNIMKKSDLIVAFYYLTNPLHRYAAPNKYYESLFLGKALVTNKGTLFSEKILEYNTGYVIDEGITSLESFFYQHTYEDDIIYKNCNCEELWKNVYMNYTNEFMNKEYTKMINKNA